MESRVGIAPTLPLLDRMQLLRGNTWDRCPVFTLLVMGGGTNGSHRASCYHFDTGESVSNNHTAVFLTLRGNLNPTIIELR